MRPFAKLYETEEFGQILVVLALNEGEDPEVRFSFAVKHFGVCTMEIKCKNTDGGVEVAEAIFNSFDTEERVIKVIKPTIDNLNKMP